MRVPEPVAVGLGVLVAVGASLAGFVIIFRTTITNDGVILLLFAAAFFVPLGAVLWVLHPQSIRSLWRSELHPMPEISRTRVGIEGEEGQGFTVTADQASLEQLGAEFLRLARECEDGQSALVEIGDETINLVRQDTPPVVAPLTWKDRLASFGALLFVALVVVSLLRGCVALQRDVANWLR